MLEKSKLILCPQANNLKTCSEVFQMYPSIAFGCRLSAPPAFAAAETIAAFRSHSASGLHPRTPRSPETEASLREAALLGYRRGVIHRPPDRSRAS